MTNRYVGSYSPLDSRFADTMFCFCGSWEEPDMDMWGFLMGVGQ